MHDRYIDAAQKVVISGLFDTDSKQERGKDLTRLDQHCQHYTRTSWCTKTTRIGASRVCAWRLVMTHLLLHVIAVGVAASTIAVVHVSEGRMPEGAEEVAASALTVVAGGRALLGVLEDKKSTRIEETRLTRLYLPVSVSAVSSSRIGEADAEERLTGLSQERELKHSISSKSPERK